MVTKVLAAIDGSQPASKALDFARQIRKTPIVVNDARFFYANRCIIPYLNEGIRMVGEGTAPWLVDHAAELLGFPVGPLQLTDEVSLDLGVKGIRANAISAGPIKTLAASGVSGLRGMLSDMAERAPLKRNVDTDDVGASALYLLSPLSEGVTGEVHYVDAGFNITAM